MCYVGGDDPLRERGHFKVKHLPDKPNTSHNCELDWSMQQYTKGRRLIASVGRVYYRPRSGRCDCTARA